MNPHQYPKPDSFCFPYPRQQILELGGLLLHIPNFYRSKLGKWGFCACLPISRQGQFLQYFRDLQQLKQQDHLDQEHGIHRASVISHCTEEFQVPLAVRDTNHLQGVYRSIRHFPVQLLSSTRQLQH